QLAVAVATLVLAACVCSPRQGWETAAQYFHAYQKITDDFRAHLPPDAKIATAIGWHYSVLLDQPVYSLYFAVKRAGQFAADESGMKKYGINTVVRSGNVGADLTFLPYFKNRHGPAVGDAPDFVFAVRD